jgi:hypothetical protein
MLFITASKVARTMVTSARRVVVVKIVAQRDRSGDVGSTIERPTLSESTAAHDEPPVPLQPTWRAAPARMAMLAGVRCVQSMSPPRNTFGEKRRRRAYEGDGREHRSAV